MSILKVKCLPWSLTLLEADLKSRPNLPVPPEVFLLWWREKVTQVGHSSFKFYVALNLSYASWFLKCSLEHFISQSYYFPCPTPSLKTTPVVLCIYVFI